MEEMILSFAASHGWKLLLIALSGIPFLGILKLAHLFDNLSTDKRKATLIGISTLFSIVMAMIYLLAIGKCNAIKMIFLSAGIFAVNQSTYSFYENYGLRKLFRKLISIFKSLFKGKFSNEQEVEPEKIDLIDDLPKYYKK